MSEGKGSGVGEIVGWGRPRVSTREKVHGMGIEELAKLTHTLIGEFRAAYRPNQLRLVKDAS